MHTTFLSEILKGRELLGKLGIDGKIILRWILGMCGLDSSDFGYHPVAIPCQHGNEPKKMGREIS
jgi:hypothetical protein